VAERNARTGLGRRATGLAGVRHLRPRAAGEPARPDRRGRPADATPGGASRRMMRTRSPAPPRRSEHGGSANVPRGTDRTNPWPRPCCSSTSTPAHPRRRA
jgi:hypothetical protein